MNAQTIMIDFPSDILLTLNENEKEFKKEIKIALAIRLYKLQKLTIGNGTTACITTKTYNQDNGRLTNIFTNTTSITIQNLNYTYDALGNLKSRTDALPVSLTFQKEDFSYDNLNRLHTITYNSSSTSSGITKTIDYDPAGLGNIVSMPDVGNYTADAQKIHAATLVENNPATINSGQDVTYTSFNKILKITDRVSNDVLDFVYGPDYSRTKTIYAPAGSANSSQATIKYFAFGNYEEKKDASGLTKDYYIYGGDDLAAIYRITSPSTGSGTTAMYYIHTDNLGSFDKVTDNNGNIVDSYHFDAWGNRRSTTNWTQDETGITHLFDRGYTGHEHLDKFGLINMNGRLYDPKLARFLSPDPYIQDPTNTQSYNRYTYCLNNPFAFIDPSGYNYSGSTPISGDPNSRLAGGHQASSILYTSNFHCEWDSDWGKYSNSSDVQYGCDSHGTNGGGACSEVFGSVINSQIQECISLINNGSTPHYEKYYYVWASLNWGSYDDKGNPVCNSHSADEAVYLTFTDANNVIAAVNAQLDARRHELGNGEAGFSDYCSATLNLCGGVAEMAVGGVTEIFSGGSSTVVSVPLCIDGGVRTATNGAKLIAYIFGNNKLGNAIPSNIGATLGKGVDMLEGSSFYKTGRNEALGALTNDLMMFQYSGATGVDLMHTLQYPTVYNKVSYGFSAFTFMYGVNGDVPSH